MSALHLPNHLFRSNPDDPEADLLSLTLLVSYISIAAITTKYLPTTTIKTNTVRWIFFWHVFDSCIHIIHEGLFLYQCFFTSGPITSVITVTSTLESKSPRQIGAHFWTSPSVFFLGQSDRVFGPHRGSSVFARMWMQYARADWRWAGTDLTIISVELVMFFLIGPLGIWVVSKMWNDRAVISRSTAFWMVAIAAAESFGNFIVILPELLTGAPNLNLSDPAVLWGHLVFMNSIWIVAPALVLRHCFHILTSADSHPDHKK